MRQPRDRRAYSRRYYLEHRERVLGHKNAYRHKIRRETLAAYGNKCQCCGETRNEFLAIDHINGDGAAHRREIGRGNLLPWLRRKGYPAGFQVLCHNCNGAKGFYGACPHEVENAG